MKRSSTPSFVCNLKLNIDDADRAFLEKRFFISGKIYNHLVFHVQKQIRKYKTDPEYKRLMALYTETKGSTDKKRHAGINEELKSLRLHYGLSEYQLHNYVKTLQHTYKRFIGSQAAQLIASDVWKTVERYLFGDGKQIHYRKYIDINTLYGAKTNSTGIIFCQNHVRVGKYNIKVRNHHDDYIKSALEHRIKYCHIIRIPMGRKYHYYVQLVLEGKPPVKHIVRKGRIGMDVGTSTVAVVSKHKCILRELGEDTVSYDKELRRINKALDRSRRASNPDNFHADGTVKRNRKTWKYSKSYQLLLMKKKTLERKQSVSLKQSHERLANEILQLGNEIYTEDMNFKALQKRSQQTIKNSRGRFQRKGRFGSSLKCHAPALFLSILSRKLEEPIKKVNTRTFRASQYNHVTNDYVKKKLSMRYVIINGRKIQRDLYSAFLLMNSNDNLTHTDRNLCMKTYTRFFKNHNRCISRIILSKKKNPSCFGIRNFYKM